MKRTATTILLDNLGCAGGSAHAIERVVTRLSGVLRAYVNAVTETAYVEFDADRCNETTIVRAVESLGISARASTHRVSTSPTPRGTFAD